MDNWLIKILGAAGLAWLFFSNDGQKFLSSIMEGITLETNVANYDCQAVADLVKGKELQNAFGRKSEILMVKKLSQISKTEKKIVCRGMVTSTSGEQTMELSVEDAGDNEIIYSIQPM